MKLFRLSAALIGAGLFAGAPAFAQTNTPTTAAPTPKQAPAHTAQKQHTGAEAPSDGRSYTAKGVTKQKTQSLSHSAPGAADGVTKQQ